MKKVLSFLFITFMGCILTAGYFVYDRYRKNPEQIFPYPYLFKSQAPAVKLDSPILVTGDRMGVYFAKFNAELAATISSNLAKPIKIQSLAKNGNGLHRTLHELRSLVQWPQIVIYQGGSEEFLEQKFVPESVKAIKQNFKLYRDDRIETALLLYPWLSRVIYRPHERIMLEDQPQLQTDVSEESYMQRLEMELLLFEQQLIQLVNLSKDRNTLLILTTTPINLDIPPKRVCNFTATIDLEKDLADLEELIKQENPKAAYSTSSKLVQQYAGNAKLYYLHGQIAKRLGQQDVALNALKQSSAYDCDPWRANEVFNSIIRKVATNHQVILFDFAKFLEQDWNKNTTFFDEYYPQNLYYEQGVKQLGLVIKQILKL